MIIELLKETKFFFKKKKIDILVTLFRVKLQLGHLIKNIYKTYDLILA